jgi:hypothetical protein
MMALNPIFPAKAGTQIQPEPLGCSRRSIVSTDHTLVGSIWAPAFAGETGKGIVRG